MSDLENKIDRILDEITEIKITHREYVIKQSHLKEKFQDHLEFHSDKIEPTCIEHTTMFTKFKAAAWILSGLNVIALALITLRSLFKN